MLDRPKCSTKAQRYQPPRSSCNVWAFRRHRAVMRASTRWLRRFCPYGCAPFVYQDGTVDLRHTVQ
eukprot:86144-Amphidinium_carterae.2